MSRVLESLPKIGSSLVLWNGNANIALRKFIQIQNFTHKSKLFTFRNLAMVWSVYDSQKFRMLYLQIVEDCKARNMVFWQKVWLSFCEDEAELGLLAEQKLQKKQDGAKGEERGGDTHA